jgi:hypothetical protein
MTRRLFLIAQIVLLALVGGAAIAGADSRAAQSPPGKPTVAKPQGGAAAIPPRLLAVRYSALTRLLLAVCGGCEREFVLVIVSPIVPY